MELKNKSLLTLYDDEMNDSKRRYQLVIGLPKIQGIYIIIVMIININLIIISNKVYTVYQILK